VTGLVDLLLVVILILQYRISRNYQGPGWWVLGFTSIVFGFLLALLRDFISIRLICIILANTLLVLGGFLIYVGVLRFLGKRENFKFILLIILLLILSLVGFTYADDNISVRTALVSGSLAIATFMTSRALLVNKPGNIRNSANFSGSVLAVFSLIFLIRTADALFFTSVDNLFMKGWFQLYGFLTILITLVLLTFGLIFMVNQRLRGEISEVQESLALSQQQYQTFMNSTSDIVYLKDDQLCYRMMNTAQAAFFGKSESDLLGKTDLELMPADAADGCHRSDREVLESGLTKINYEKVGSLIYETRKFPVQLINGKMGVGAFIRNITETRRAEGEIELKNQQLEQMNAEKDKLFSIIAHDLRSPFNALLGLTELMTDETEMLTLDEIRKAAGMVSKSANSLNNQLGNLLEWSRIQMNVISINPVLLNLKMAVDTELELFKEAAEKKKIRLTNLISETIQVSADKQMLHSILRNFLANAIKFTKPIGEVTLTAKWEPDDVVEISISDTGIGMSPEILNKLFTLNAKISRKGTEGEPSSGLGLIICKELVEKQGGRIWVDSEEGKGSTFFFTLISIQ